MLTPGARTRHVLWIDRVAFPLQLLQRRIHVEGVPQHDNIPTKPSARAGSSCPFPGSAGGAPRASVEDQAPEVWCRSSPR